MANHDSRATRQAERTGRSVSRRRAIALAATAGVAALGGAVAAAPPPRPKRGPTRRILIPKECLIGDYLGALIITGSDEPPIVSLAENVGWPRTCTIYADTTEHRGDKGVCVLVYFAERPRQKGQRFAINLYQPGMAEDVSDTAGPLP